MNTIEFAETHKDFVLKLHFALEGGTSQIRRVRLPRIATDERKISYDELEGLAISFVFPEDPRENLSVKLTYVDVDEDCVLIGSTDELVDAVDQFSDRKLLRITAEVKRKAARATHAERAEPVRISSRASNDVSTQADGRQAQPHPQIQNAVDSIVTIVSAAAHSIQGQLKAAPVVFKSAEAPNKSKKDVVEAQEDTVVKKNTANNGSPSDAKPRAVAVPLKIVATKKSREDVAEAQEDTKVAAKPKKVIASIPVKLVVPETFLEGQDEEDTKPAVKTEKAKNGSPPPLKSRAEMPLRKASDDTKEAPKGKAEKRGEPVSQDANPVVAIYERPFIHGRHTCDGCLHTPIIGKRYHAKNIPDYDLCESCFLNYKGTEIEFEVVELDRDRPYQMRWHRRHNRLTRGKAARGGSRGGSRGSGRCGGRKVEPSEDVKQEKNANVPETPVEGSKECSQDTSPAKNPFGPPTFAPGFHHPPVEAEADDYAMREALRLSLLETSTQAQSESTPQPTAPAEEEVMRTSTPVEEKRTEEPISNSDLVSEEESEDKEKDVVDESKLCAPSDDQVLENAERSVEGDELDVSPEKPSSEISFSQDAEENGSVALALGKTLDKVSEAIDGLVSELDKSSSFNDDESVEDDSVVEEESEKEVDEESEKEVEEGATIVESVLTPNDDGVKSVHTADDGWQVVSDDQSPSTAGDAALAHAAQMIGSALFNSDMSRSADGEMVSTITGDGHSVSSASSVPTTIASLASENRSTALQRSRWTSQLAQLHEIGFYNDDENIEVLERLTAANIGSGITKEVTVPEVLNEIYRGD